MTFIFDLDCVFLHRYMHTKIKFLGQGFQKLDPAEQNKHIDRQTHDTTERINKPHLPIHSVSVNRANQSSSFSSSSSSRYHHAPLHSFIPAKTISFPIFPTINSHRTHTQQSDDFMDSWVLVIFTCSTVSFVVFPCNIFLIFDVVR